MPVNNERRSKDYRKLNKLIEEIRNTQEFTNNTYRKCRLVHDIVNQYNLEPTNIFVYTFIEMHHTYKTCKLFWAALRASIT